MRDKLWRWTKRMIILALVLVVVGAIAGWFSYQRWVVEDPGAHMSRPAIVAIISQESPVLYRDGTTRVGVFFSQEHRAYVEYSEIPEAWVEAIVAAEDKNFWSHPGIDPEGIARAMFRNLQAGEVVAGGSTLTQQTAKNLYYRPDRSLTSKWRELVNALRLEEHYSKEDILEFYANQFHVSANGRGLGIAARYFFDKTPAELDTLECAFLAGMVKAPASYNPFIGVSEDRRIQARVRAKDRTRYVLDRMQVLGLITDAEHDDLVDREIPFKQGKFRYDTSILLDEVAQRLEEAPFPDLFKQLGIDNPSTAGIRIVTTLDEGLQREATWSLWNHLSSVGPLLEGTKAQDLVVTKPPADLAHGTLRPHEFALATVLRNDPEIELEVPGGTCKVDKAALQRMGDILAQAEKGETWRTANKKELVALREALPKGTQLWASLREAGVCDLEVRPALQGAVLVLEDGQIRAMVGGSDNRNFNRAIDARRQLGSTWKPVVYYAGLQLGWTPTDLLDNRRNAFHFEGTWYYPRPDHESTDFVSMSWAATRSENLASVWLLAHLTDRLTPDEFRQIATQVGMGPQDGEDRNAWIARTRDDAGVISTPGRFEEIAFYAVKSELGDVVPPEERVELRSLLYGRGAEEEKKRVRKDAEKVGALEATFLGLESKIEPCRQELDVLRASLGSGIVPPAPERLKLLSRGGRLVFVCGKAPKDAIPLDPRFLQGMAEGLQLPIDLSDASSMVIEGRLSVSSLEAVRRGMKRRELVLAGSDAYDWEVVSLHPDFRLLVGMRYVGQLASRLGVRAEVPPVLSMPLGAVEISLEEAGLLYQSMLHGDRWTFPGNATAPSNVPGLRSSEPVPSPDSATLLIAEIRDQDGNLLYKARPTAEPVIDPAAGRQVGDMLRNVVRWGTGKRALEAVTVEGVTVPVAGKTGTTNSYKNVAFSGFVPRAGASGFQWGDGYTVTAYVGYDDNRPMRRGGTRVQGANGALPVWIGTAQGLASTGLLGKPNPDAGEVRDELPFVRIPLDEATGLVAEGDVEVGPSALVVTGIEQAAARLFMPWAPPETEAPHSEAMAPGTAEVAPTDPIEDEAALRGVWIEQMEAPPDDRLHPVEVPDVIPDAPDARSPLEDDAEPVHAVDPDPLEPDVYDEEPSDADPDPDPPDPDPPEGDPSDAGVPDFLPDDAL